MKTEERKKERTTAAAAKSFNRHRGKDREERISNLNDEIDMSIQLFTEAIESKERLADVRLKLADYIFLFFLLPQRLAKRELTEKRE